MAESSQALSFSTSLKTKEFDFLLLPYTPMLLIALLRNLKAVYLATLIGHSPNDYFSIFITVSQTSHSTTRVPLVKILLGHHLLTVFDLAIPYISTPVTV